MASIRCPSCELPNPAGRSRCARCRTSLGTRVPSAPSWAGERAESIASVLYVVAFVSSCAGGGGVIALLGLVFGEEVMQSNTVLIWGFMIGTLGSLATMVFAIRTWKARAEGAAFEGGVVHASMPKAPTASRTEFLVFSVLTAAFGVFVLYYLSEWEREGGTRNINTILYGLYMLLGKWGVAVLLWIASAVMLWKGIARRS